MQTLSTEEMNSILIELEQAQLALVRSRGSLPPTDETPWTPVARRKATDSDVDNIVKQAEQELGDSSINLSKMERARLIFNNNPGMSRKEMLGKFATELDLTPAASSTYYQTLRHGQKKTK
jgi:hypothetical protein